MALVQRCNQLLNEAELKITQLKDNYASLPASNGLDWNEELEP
jgi:exonuclease VII small subunit